MMTVGQPGPGAIGEPCSDISASRAAGKFPISTVVLPMAIPLGAGLTHTIPHSPATGVDAASRIQRADRRPQGG